MKIFDAVTVDGVSLAYRHYYEDKPLSIYLAGDLGGATAQLEAYVPDRSVWIPVIGESYSVIGLYTVNLPPSILRLNLVGGTLQLVNAWVESDSASLRELIRSTVV